MQKIVIGFSGGMDSATLLGLMLEQGYEVHCCTFYYGSKHNKYENQAARDIVAYYQNLGKPVVHYFFDISNLMGDFKSNLLLSGGAIPEGHYEGENMRQTVVPGRNLIFASIMSGLAESIDATYVALGIHSGDHFIYPDCRDDFAKALDLTVFLSSDKKVQVIAPLAEDTKATILKKGYKISVPYRLTRTCYKDQEHACGICGSCNERLEAFLSLNLIDPVQYE